jgi:exodeoxyribonuclease VII small subunit
MAARENLAAAAENRSSELRRAAGQLTVASAVRNKRLSGIRADHVNSPAPKKPEPPKKPDFERSLARLEEVVRRLESPQLSLDDAMKLFEEGVALSRECQKQLEEAEGRVEILLKKADGKLAAEPFDPEREPES